MAEQEENASTDAGEASVENDSESNSDVDAVLTPLESTKYNELVLEANNDEANNAHQVEAAAIIEAAETEHKHGNNSHYSHSESPPTAKELKDKDSINEAENLHPKSDTNEITEYIEDKNGTAAESNVEGMKSEKTVTDHDIDENESRKADDDHETDENESRKADDELAGSSRPRRIILSSDEEDDIDAVPASPKSKDDSESEGHEERAEVGVGELMTNIFGEDSDDEKDDADQRQTGKDMQEDEDEPRYIRDEEKEDERVWDFDEMMREKKNERRRPRRRRRDGSIDVGGAYDDQIKMLIDAMKAAAKDDRHSNMERRPALQKRKMLPHVKAMLIKHDLMEAIIDNGMMNVLSEWLAPLPDKSLPALEIRTDLLKILQDYNRLEPGTLKQSGLGRAVMLLYKHPRETKENKALASRLISDWARPIFQLDTDFRSMTKDERIQRDYAQLPEVKRRRLDVGSENSDVEKETSEPRPGDKGFIMRARVPRPSQKDYVVRPKSNVEGQFRGATKNRLNNRFDRTQREFKERTKQQRAQRAVAVSINRVNL